MEQWKPAFGFEGIYECSTSGKVRSVRNVTSSKQGKILKLNNSTGYSQVQLRKNGAYHHAYVHRLVMETFVGPSSLTVNHKNGIKTDNRIENLEYATHKENLLHATTVLGKRRGVLHWKSRLNDNNIRDIRRRLLAGETHQSIADLYGVGRVNITCIAIGRTWKHVT